MMGVEVLPFPFPVGENPEGVLTLRLGLHNLQGLEGGGCGGRGDGGGEDVGAGVVTEEVGDFLVGGYEASQRGE